MTLNDRICATVDTLIMNAQLTNSESSMKNTSKALTFLEMRNGIDYSYKKTLKGFRDYIKNTRNWLSDCLTMRTLDLLIVLVDHPPKLFPIGTHVSFTHNNKSDSGTVFDYDYKINRYQVKTEDSIVGWIAENQLEQTQNGFS